MFKILNLFRKNLSGDFESVVIKQNLPEEYTFVLNQTQWEGSTPPFTQTVLLPGITPESTGVFGIAQGASSDVLNDVCQSQIQLTNQNNGSIVVSAFKLKPTLDIPCVITNLHKVKLNSEGEAIQ